MSKEPPFKYDRMPAPPKVIDCFLFYNEIAMLKYRLHLLYPVVDKFVLVESTRTFTGAQKPLYFETYKSEFAPYLDKIIHVVVKNTPLDGVAWDREHFQRHAINRGIQTLNLQPNDIIHISDVDELPSPYLLSFCKIGSLKSSIYALQQDMYYYNPTIKMSCDWNFAKLLPFHLYSENQNPDQLRYAANTLTIPRGGWHFSYFGSPSFISNKIKHFSHQEFNTPTITDINNIQAAIQEKKDLFGRDIEFTYIPISENRNLPPDIHLLLEYSEQDATKLATPAPSP